MKKIIVTGGAGFIGSAFVAEAVSAGYHPLVIDKLTYAGNLPNIQKLIDESKINFFQLDICESEKVYQICKQEKPIGIINFAAESHVDNSITGPKPFIETNISGVFSLLEAFKKYWSEVDSDTKRKIKFLQVSTDEVFGELGETGYFSEATPYSPRSPYSSSKAAGDLLVKAWHHTYDLPTLITNCSNNYGPRHYPEKLIPRIIQNALEGKPLPVYGKGENIRDWIHVEDHAAGVLLAFEKGKIGESYCFGGNSERKNIDVVKSICKTLDQLRPRKSGGYEGLITFVTDRLGHDFRYAIDDSKAKNELGYRRKYKSFEDGLKETIKWYLDNQSWVEQVKAKTLKGAL